MADSPPTLEQVATLAAAFGAGGVVKWLLELWRGRRDKAAAEPADFARAAGELHEKLSEAGGELLDEFRKEFRFLRGRVVDLQKQADRATIAAAAAREDAAIARAADARCQRELAVLREEIRRAVASAASPPPGPAGSPSLPPPEA